MILIDILVKLFMTALISAAMLIAYKNTWGISTSPEKRNKMSLLGAFSYI